MQSTQLLCREFLAVFYCGVQCLIKYILTLKDLQDTLVLFAYCKRKQLRIIINDVRC